MFCRTPETRMDNLARPEGLADYGSSFVRFVAHEGSLNAVSPMLKYLDDDRQSPGPRASVRNIRPALIADIAHFMCLAHGRLPGVVDYAATKIVDDDARAWFVQAINAFALERSFLNRLTVAAGPATRQLGQEKVTALVTNQVKNFKMIATSDRKGCAAGAAIAFVLDWRSTRRLLEASALKLGIDPSHADLPDTAMCQTLAENLSVTDATGRAMMFGAEQLLGQQRGLWKLIAARHAEMVNAG
jgi:hypothetical protein